MLWLVAGLLRPRFLEAVSLVQQVPTFRSRLDVVRTAVAVIDVKTGQAVTGLTERDFTISENGVPQTISSFVDQSGQTPGNAGAPADPKRRVFLFILQAGPVASGPYKVHDGVSQFIRERLNPQDLVGVLSLGRLSPLTSDHKRIAAIVERLKQPVPLEFIELQRTDPKLEGTQSPIAAQRFADNWLEPGSAETAFFRSPASLLIGTPEYKNNLDKVQAPWDFRVMAMDGLKVVAGIEYLRNYQGEKHLILVSAGAAGFSAVRIKGDIMPVGLYLDSTEDDRRLAAKANDAGVAIDVIQTSAFWMSTVSNAMISEQSGGVFSSLRVASQQLSRIDDASRHGYVLGYVPRNPDLDGKYRNIKVTVNRKDVTVVYRRGYTATADPGHIDSADVYARTRMRDAAAGTTDLTDIRVAIKASTAARVETARDVQAELTIDVSQLPLTESDGKWEGFLDLIILCGNKKQEVVGKDIQRMKLSMTPVMYERARVGGVPYSTKIAVSELATVVKAVVYHYDSDRLGTATATIAKR
jgi:VWFA-related protein